MLNNSADYSIRAVLFLARNAEHGSRSAGAVARALGVPRNYIGKVLNTLAHEGVLDSVRGPKGGFRLATPPSQITLNEVVAPFQDITERSVCLLGDRPCEGARPCDVHLRWCTMADQVTDFFRNTTIAQLLQPLSRERSIGGAAEAASAQPGATTSAQEPHETWAWRETV